MRYAVLRVSPYFLLEMCREGEIHARVIGHAVPDDAKYVRTYVDGTWGYIKIVIESASFQELKEGDEIPELPSIIFDKVQ